MGLIEPALTVRHIEDTKALNYSKLRKKLEEKERNEGDQ